MPEASKSGGTSGSVLLRTELGNYSAAERAGVLVFGLVLPLVMIPVGVYLLLTVGARSLSLSYILPILGAVMMFVILGDHAPQTIALRDAGIEMKRLWKRQRADARDILFVLAMHRKSRHAIMLVKKDGTAVAFGPGLSTKDFARARTWAHDLAQRQGIQDEGDLNVTGGSDATRAMVALFTKHNLGAGGRRR